MDFLKYLDVLIGLALVMVLLSPRVTAITQIASSLFRLRQWRLQESGSSQQQILADYPQLEPEDFLAVYAYAAELAGHEVSTG